RESVRPRTLWESLFVPPGYEREVQGLGSGFIFRDDGLVVTNEHVVRGAVEAVVTLADGREFTAEVVGSDGVTDIAVLRMHGLDAGDGAVAVAPLGTSGDLMIGEWVVALGNPLGYMVPNAEPTVTAGVVSGTGRDIRPEGEDMGYYLDMIQTDAAINPGNSGGPLVNALGEVIGVNASIISRGGGSDGLGFAIPIDRAHRIALDLLDDGRVRRAWVGLEVELGRARADGRRPAVRVASVAPSSPAERAGLEPGDVVRSVDGEPIRIPLDWEAMLLGARVGEPIRMAVGPEGERTVSVVPDDLPSVTAERTRALEGFEFITLNEAIRSQYGLRSERGALIASLSETAQRRLGLREGDLIVQINRVAIETAEQAASLLRELAGRDAVRMIVERDGRYVSTSFYIRR
ncbi:MAG: trypsin-like peptidase domain-containing protein, partial [Gemmatimonadota bacterium]